MRTLALLLLLSAGAPAQPKLTPKDESDIRTAIEERAKIDNQKGTGEVWTERGPLVYRVRTIEPLTADVATAEADGVRTGAFSEHRDYTFIMMRSHGHWTVAKRIAACPPSGIQLICGSARSRPQPLSESPQS
jgi:hypothetical protein